MSTVTVPAEQFNALVERVARLEDERAISNVMVRRAYIHSAARHDLEIKYLWSKRDDIVLEIEDWGGWTGQQAIKYNYVDVNPFPGGTPGLMVEHHLTTGMIEVAGDRQTAKAVWMSPGHETIPIGEGPPKPHWCYNKYAVDFIKEDGEWKIWHLHVLSVFRTPFNKDWVHTSENFPEYFGKRGDKIPGMTDPDRKVSFNQDYSTRTGPQLQPVPPEPYATWKDTWSAVDPYIHPEAVQTPLHPENGMSFEVQKKLLADQTTKA